MLVLSILASHGLRVTPGSLRDRSLPLRNTSFRPSVALYWSRGYQFMYREVSVSVAQLFFVAHFLRYAVEEVIPDKPKSISKIVMLGKRTRIIVECFPTCNWFLKSVFPSD
jgi:hypothetical protein